MSLLPLVRNFIANFIRQDTYPADVSRTAFWFDSGTTAGAGGLWYNWRGVMYKLLGFTTETIGTTNTIDLAAILNAANTNVSAGAAFSITLGYFKSGGGLVNTAMNIQLRTYNSDRSSSTIANIKVDILPNPSGLKVSAAGALGYIQQQGDYGVLGFTSSPGSIPLITGLYLTLVQNSSGSEDVYWLVLNGTFNQAYNYASPPTLSYQYLYVRYILPVNAQFVPCNNVGSGSYDSGNLTQFLLTLPSTTGWLRVLPQAPGWRHGDTAERIWLQGNYSNFPSNPNFLRAAAIQSDLNVNASATSATTATTTTLAVNNSATIPLAIKWNINGNDAIVVLPLGSTLTASNLLLHKRLTFKMGNVTNFTLQANAGNANSIDGGSSINLANAYGCIEIAWNGSRWEILSKLGS